MDKNLENDFIALLLRDHDPSIKPRCSYHPTSYRVCVYFQWNPDPEKFPMCKGCPVGFVLLQLSKTEGKQ